MRALGITTVAAMSVVLMGSPAFAQTERGYIIGAGGIAISQDARSGDALGEAGVRIAPHLLAFGDVGQFHNLQPSEIQPAIDSTTATLAASSGLDVIGTPRVPAWYSLGGLRFEMPTRSRISPYVLGGLGFARLTPAAQFTYSSGTIPGLTPELGDDVTSQLISLSTFTQPPATTSLMYSVGGGVDVPVVPHWAVDVGYRFSRINADTVNAQAVTFGFGYRF